MVTRESNNRHDGKNLNEEGKVCKNTESALFLFGGSESVFRKLTEIIKEKIKNFSSSDLIEIENHLRLEKNTLSHIKKGRRSVTKNIFLDLKAFFKLSLDVALGEPIGLDDPIILEHWEEEYRLKPMKVVSCCGSQKGTSIPKNPIDLKLYVTLRAIGEFYKLSQ